MLALQKRRKSPLLDKVFIFVAYSGVGKSWLTITSIIWLFQLSHVEILPRQLDFLKSTVAVLVAWVLSRIIKLAVKRRRPFETAGIFSLHTKPAYGTSFPSTHTATSAALFFALLADGHPLSGSVGIWALLIALSRIHLRVHFLSDVVAGLATALFAVYLNSYWSFR